MDYNPQDPSFWLELSPDYVVEHLISEFHMFSTSVRATYAILLTDSNMQDLVMQDGTKFVDFINEQEKRIDAVRQKFLAASSWKTAYRQGKRE